MKTGQIAMIMKRRLLVLMAVSLVGSWSIDPQERAVCGTGCPGVSRYS